MTDREQTRRDAGRFTPETEPHNQKGQMKEQWKINYAILLWLLALTIAEVALR